eukprot:g60732.t1
MQKSNCVSATNAYKVQAAPLKFHFFEKGWKFYHNLSSCPSHRINPCVCDHSLVSENTKCGQDFALNRHMQEHRLSCGIAVETATEPEQKKITTWGGLFNALKEDVLGLA